MRVELKLVFCHLQIVGQVTFGIQVEQGNMVSRGEDVGWHPHFEYLAPKKLGGECGTAEKEYQVAWKGQSTRTVASACECATE